jgi:hypothetical protein
LKVGGVARQFVVQLENKPGGLAGRGRSRWSSAWTTERVPDAAGRRLPPRDADSTTQAIHEPVAAVALMQATRPYERE